MTHNTVDMNDQIRHAILIGINDYQIKPLSYCDNDVKLMESVLISRCPQV